MEVQPAAAATATQPLLEQRTTMEVQPLLEQLTTMETHCTVWPALLVHTQFTSWFSNCTVTSTAYLNIRL